MTGPMHHFNCVSVSLSLPRPLFLHMPTYEQLRTYAFSTGCTIVMQGMDAHGNMYDLSMYKTTVTSIFSEILNAKMSQHVPISANDICKCSVFTDLH